jgi:pantetheine-phosphate adenylyltransferase
VAIPNHQPRNALYPGSFDGLTYGHLDLIQRGCQLFDRLVVGVAQNSRKNPWFTPEERMEQIRACTEGLTNLELVRIEGLTVHAAKQHGAQFILRGLRAVSDFDFEFQLAIMNHEVMPSVETIFLATSPEYIFLSSSMVKEVWLLGGDVSRFVPPPVLAAFEARKRPTG